MNKVNTSALYKRQDAGLTRLTHYRHPQSRLSRLVLKAKAKPSRPESEVVAPTRRPTFYGDPSVTKLPDPRALADAMYQARKNVTAASTLKNVGNAAS